VCHQGKRIHKHTCDAKLIIMKDLYLKDIAPRQLNFSSSFTLVSTADRRTKVQALILYFDTFFTSTGEPVSPDTKVKIVKEGDIAVAEIWPVGGKAAPQRRPSQGEGLQGKRKAKITSFSTGPRSIPTHWKQTIFLLREPITMDEGAS
jgi:type I protein arginine methyltransferase